MQESLLNTVKKMQAEQKVNVEELEVILNSDIEEVVSLCKKACVKPKTDSMGNAFFTRNDVDVLKKMKELYSRSQAIQEESFSAPEKIENNETPVLDSPSKKINFLQKAKKRIKNESSLPVSAISSMPQISAGTRLFNKLEKLEDNLISRMSEILSEKMDGFDEIIVELIRAKTENENLRQQVNSLNKQIYILKGELASFNQLPFGLYTKKDTDTL